MDSPSFDMLRWMDAEASEDFARLVARCTHPAGQAIYTQQEFGTQMYRVTRGLVRLMTRADDGREVVFLLFGEGDCFGVSSLVDGGPRPQTAECLIETELEILELEGFEDLLRRHASFARAVMMVLTLQMRVVSQYFVSSHLTSLASRVAMRIIENARIRPHESVTGQLVFSLTQSELAALVGASRQAVNKVLQALHRDGALTLSHRAIIVKDLQELRRHVEAV
ncbi:MAG TPA: Crp/Fnr family transcriptional regulator [Steroidobacteraceae bacterium]|nr:Crp/Fnr family transcriptional regulator [Steroidobacteraceae bacterium]